MQYRGRFYAVGIVVLFNILRYYYMEYFDVPKEYNYLILAPLFLLIPWWAGKQYDRAKFYSEIDPLTETYNRRIVEKQFQILASKVKKGNGRVGIVMIDINDFKVFNDTFGHHKGDELLIKFASLLKRHASKDDIVARWGGDEFVLIVPNINENFKSTYPEGLNHELKKIRISESTSVKASVGLAVFPDNGETFETLINAADLEMYASKNFAKLTKKNDAHKVLENSI
ncbi:diguanylate cyclase [Paenisporosarcina sp. TG20]|uniref:GGDEF domain-containing protein n=1 Tax=Paenisporosarcina sp. TG20 TaxID=1211706 RepID=UPI000304BA23|nr:diguanylate cyclase [Paenisporosarcina sp. TG20]